MEEFGATLARLCAVAPLLFIGILVLVDPAAITGLIRRMEFGIRNFRNWLQGMPYVDQYQEAHEVLSTPALLGLRIGGVALVVFALLPLLLDLPVH
jgi:hypothetical protein